MKIRVVGISVLGAAILVAGGLALFAFDFPRVRSNDMAPGLRQGDLVLACRVCGTPKAGDVVLFTNGDTDDESTEKLIYRRVVAVPGDHVEVVKGQVLVNGQPIASEPAVEVEIAGLDEVTSAPKTFEQSTETLGGHRYSVIRDRHVPSSGDLPAQELKNAFFVLADRRTFARDSRRYGPIARTSIRAIVKRVLSSGDKDPARQRELP